MGLNLTLDGLFSGDVTTCPTCVLIQISLVVKSGDIFYFYSRTLFCDCPYVTNTGDVDSSDSEDCKLLGELFKKSYTTHGGKNYISE